ncbi:uncharacterized protein LOC135809055 [Sycon ciliatum]|uniref:uncharacterized protein LOC135809055 n=1 Tax=Sycon ciliatum TaxID=27933 RepID=UPI0020AA9D74|eukprot:scpid92743/ scgid15787/ 
MSCSLFNPLAVRSWVRSIRCGPLVARASQIPGNNIDQQRVMPCRYQSTLLPFHHAFPVNDLDAARHFYGTVLGCEEGRSSNKWIDFSLFGHQIVAHHSKVHPYVDHLNPVDGDEVPVPHFGVVLEWKQFEKFSERLVSYDVKFIIEPHIRFPGLTGEQYTMFFKDPAGNNLEFKALRHPEQLFQKFTTKEQELPKE